jgi:hypothetical protein
MNDFEQEIERELHRVLDPATAGTIPAWRATRSGLMGKKLLGGAGAAIGLKVLTGFAVAAAAATLAGAATETVITGSVNPTVWGQQVKEQVEDCKKALNGEHGGIGHCVSNFANKHGETTSDNKPTTEGTGSEGAGTPTGSSDSSGHGKPADPGSQGKGQGKGHTPGPKP